MSISDTDTYIQIDIHTYIHIYKHTYTVIMYARYATLMLDGPQGRPAVYPFWVVPKMGKVSLDP